MSSAERSRIKDCNQCSEPTRSRSGPSTSVIFVTGPAVSKPRSPTITYASLTRTRVPFLSLARLMRSEERRVGKECRSLCDWSSDVCSSDLDFRDRAGGFETKVAHNHIRFIDENTRAFLELGEIDARIGVAIIVRAAHDYVRRLPCWIAEVSADAVCR